jgi:hypothetical protein
MSERHPDAEEVGVVLIGSFNPGIFHPEWFRRQEILLPAEAEKAKIGVISVDVTEIEFLDMRLDVFPERFILRTQDASRAEKLQDVVLGVMRRLFHTPITACGINNEIQFDLGDEAYWHKIGHTLAPKELVWNEVLSSPGMQSLTIKAPRGGDFPGVINVTVQPAKRFTFGLLVSTNWHYDVPRDEAGIPRSARVVDYVVSEWKVALEQCRRVACRIFSTIKKETN